MLASSSTLYLRVTILYLTTLVAKVILKVGLSKQVGKTFIALATAH